MKSKAVSTDPVATSRQLNCTSGNTLKMVANNSEATRTDATRSRPLKATSYQGSQPCTCCNNIRRPTLSDSDTSITKPTASTMVRDVRRFLRKSMMLLREGLGTTVQMEFREFCIWPNTVVAPMSMAAMPANVANKPPPLRLDWATAACTVAAASGPMVSCS